MSYPALPTTLSIQLILSCFASPEREQLLGGQCEAAGMCEPLDGQTAEVSRLPTAHFHGPLPLPCSSALVGACLVMLQEEEERRIKLLEEVERERKREGEVQARLREQREKEDREKAAAPAPAPGKFLTPAQRARLAAEQGGAAPAPPSRDNGDRWGRREEPPPATREPPRPAAPAAPAPAPAPGKFIPPHLRKKLQEQQQQQ